MCTYKNKVRNHVRSAITSLLIHSIICIPFHVTNRQMLYLPSKKELIKVDVRVVELLASTFELLLREFKVESEESTVITTKGL